MENLQLAHMCCNRQKSDKLVEKQILDAEVELISNKVVLLMFICSFVNDVRPKKEKEK